MTYPKKTRATKETVMGFIHQLTCIRGATTCLRERLGDPWRSFGLWISPTTVEEIPQQLIGG